MRDGAITLERDGEAVSTHEARTRELRLYGYGYEDDVYFAYTDADGAVINVLMRAPKSVTVDGELALLDLRPTLERDFALDIPDTARITTLTVARGNVDLRGTAATVNVTTTAGRVHVAEGAGVGKVRAVGYSSVTGPGVRLSTDYTLIDPVKEKTSPYQSGFWYGDVQEAAQPRSRDVEVYFDGTVPGDYDSLTLQRGDVMDAACGLLQEHLRAYDKRSGEQVEGVFRFDGNRFAKAEPGVYAWTFTPGDETYRRARGTLRIDIEGEE